MMPDPIDVVVSPDVLVAALSGVSAAAIQFPAMPPKTPNAAADTIGVFVAGEGDFALILSEPLLEAVATALTDRRGLAWAFDRVDEALDTVCRIAKGGQGGFVAADATVELPGGVGRSDEIALRTAASKDLGATRAVATYTERLYKHVRSWQPVVPWWPADQRITLLSPEQFRDLVHRARWGMRRAR